jgi:hypothetical protein
MVAGLIVSRDLADRLEATMTEAADPPLVGDLLATIEALRVDNEALRAKLVARDTAVWLPLKKAAGEVKMPYETARAWAAAGLIESDKDGGRVVVNVTDLLARLLRLGLRS